VSAVVVLGAEQESSEFTAVHGVLLCWLDSWPAHVLGWVRRDAAVDVREPSRVRPLYRARNAAAASCASSGVGTASSSDLSAVVGMINVVVIVNLLKSRGFTQHEEPVPCSQRARPTVGGMRQARLFGCR
jgi:hypothetical protein